MCMYLKVPVIKHKSFYIFTFSISQPLNKILKESWFFLLLLLLRYNKESDMSMNWQC